MKTDYGRIDRVAFKTATSVFFATAMLATIARFTIRLKFQKRLSSDDYVLLFASLVLIAAFTLIHVMFDDIYFDMGLIPGSAQVVGEESASPDFETRHDVYQKLAYSAEVLCWATVLSVKMTYLLFFRQMLDRLRVMLIYWKVTTTIVAISGVYWICSAFLSCPHFGVSAAKCAQQSGFARTIIVPQLGNGLNLLTDLLIVVIPVVLIRKVKIRLFQKVVLGTFLCLSLCMFAICLVRITNGFIRGNDGVTLDIQWNIFWLIIEASVAVTVVSFTAFRSLYTFKEQHSRDKKRPNLSLQYYRQKASERKRQRRYDDFGDSITDKMDLALDIPSPTLTVPWSSQKSRACDTATALPD